MLLECGGELPRGLPCVITGTVLALGFVNDQEQLVRVDPVFDSHQLFSHFITCSEDGLKQKTETSLSLPNPRVLLFHLVTHLLVNPGVACDDHFLARLPQLNAKATYACTRLSQGLMHAGRQFNRNGSVSTEEVWRGGLNTLHFVQESADSILHVQG